MDTISLPGFGRRKHPHRPRRTPLAGLPAFAFGAGLPWLSARAWLAFFAALPWCAAVAFFAPRTWQPRSADLAGNSSLAWRPGRPRGSGSAVFAAIAFRSDKSWRPGKSSLAWRPGRPRDPDRPWFAPFTALAFFTRRPARPWGPHRPELTVGAIAARRAITHFEQAPLDLGQALDRALRNLGDRRTGLGRYELAPPFPIAIASSKNLGDGLAQRINQSVVLLGQFRHAGF
jgi:hypothetical protein